MQQDRPTYLTPEGRARLQAELDELRNVRRPQVAARIHEAKQYSNATDNAEYEDAKTEQAFIEGRIRTVEEILRNARVIDGAHGNDRVTLGSRVTVRFADGSTEAYLLVGKAEANPREGRISNESPVGQALLGRRLNEAVSVMAPGGVTRMTVVGIE